MREEARRQRLVEKRREDVKREIVLKALSEASDLEALRMEKRAILAEEKRLKALLELERMKAARKADRQAAARAEKQRQASKLEYRREKVSESCVPCCLIKFVWRLTIFGELCADTMQ